MVDDSVSCYRTGNLKSHEPEDKTAHQKYTPDDASPITQHPHIFLPDLALDVVVLCSRLDHAITPKTGTSPIASTWYYFYAVTSCYLLHTRLQNFSSWSTMEK